MNKLFHALFAVVAVFITVLFVIMLVIMAGLVVTRYVFSWSPAWSEEITRYCMVWMVMLGGAVLVYFDDHIALHFSLGQLTPRGKTVQRLVSRAVMLFATAIVAWTGFKFSLSQINYCAAGCGFSLTIPTIAVPISATLMVVFIMYRGWRDIMFLAGKDLPPDLNQGKYMEVSSFSEEEDSAP